MSKTLNRLLVEHVTTESPFEHAQQAAVPTEAAAYSLRQPIGTGGFGEVWEAVQTALMRVVAVKRMREDVFRNANKKRGELDRLKELFHREALITAQLEHPNVVAVHELGADEEGRPLLAMKLVRGKSWDKMLREDFTNEETDYYAKHLPILIDVAQAVAFAHSRGIIHRDLKPSQVMVGEFGEVQLMDWGIAKLFDPKLADIHGVEGFSNEFSYTPQEEEEPLSGTPAYMAPEQTGTGGKVGPWTDVYLLGGMLYFLLTGKAPHFAENSVDSFCHAMDGMVVPPWNAVQGRDLPPELVEVCLKALAREPAERISSAKDFVDALEEFLTGAGRRRESMALADQVQEIIRDPERGRDYQELARCSELIQRSRTLWQDNPRAKALQVRVLVEFTRAALRHGDLSLARLTAEQLEDGADKKGLLSQIEIAVRDAARGTRVKAWLVITLILLIAIVIADIVIVFQWQRDSIEGGAFLMNRRNRGEVHRLKNALAVAEEKLQLDKMRQMVAKLDDVRRREAELAPAFERLTPLVLALTPPPDAPPEDQDPASAAPWEQMDALMADRAALREYFGAESGEPPISMAIAEPNWILSRPRDAKEWQQAFLLYKDAEPKYPHRPEPPAGMAIAAARLGRTDVALRCLDRALALSTNLKGEESDMTQALKLMRGQLVGNAAPSK